MAGGKKEPVALEELIKRKQEEAEKAAKPVFLSKAERQAAALRALEEKRGARGRQLEAMRAEHARALEDGRASCRERV